MFGFPDLLDFKAENEENDSLNIDFILIDTLIFSIY